MQAKLFLISFVFLFSSFSFAKWGYDVIIDKKIQKSIERAIEKEDMQAAIKIVESTIGKKVKKIKGMMLLQDGKKTELHEDKIKTLNAKNKDDSADGEVVYVVFVGKKLRRAIKQGDMQSVAKAIEDATNTKVNKLQKTILSSDGSKRVIETDGLSSSKELHKAITLGDIKLTEDLLKKTNPNVQDKEGNTPLHIASKKGYEKIVELLIEYGANPNAINRKGKNPLDLAYDNKHKAVIKVLKSRGVIKTQTIAI